MGNSRRRRSTNRCEDWSECERASPRCESDDYRRWSSVWDLRRAPDDSSDPPAYPHPAAEAYFGPLVAAAPPGYREWLARLSAAYVRDAMTVTAFPEAVARGEDPERKALREWLTADGFVRLPRDGFEGAWTHLPVGELRTVGYLLSRVRTDGLFFTALCEIEYTPEKPYEDGNEDLLSLLDRLLPGGLPVLVRAAAADADSTIRLMAASVCHERSFGLVNLNERLRGLAPSVLPPLLDDPVPEVRTEAALRLAHFGRSLGTSLVPAITKILAEAAAAGMDYMVPRGKELDGDVWGYRHERAAFMRALAVDLDAGPDCFGALGADGLPELLDCLRHVINWEPLARPAAVALGRIGVATAETLYLLAALRDSPRQDETRRTAGAAFDTLSGRLAAGTASVPDTGDGLLLAVWRNPDDRTARLAYADWLDESERPERAEYVRLCAAEPSDDAAAAERRRELALSFTSDTTDPDRPGWFALWRWATARPTPF